MARLTWWLHIFTGMVVWGFGSQTRPWTRRMRRLTPPLHVIEIAEDALEPQEVERLRALSLLGTNAAKNGEEPVAVDVDEMGFARNFDVRRFKDRILRCDNSAREAIIFSRIRSEASVLAHSPLLRSPVIMLEGCRSLGEALADVLANHLCQPESLPREPLVRLLKSLMTDEIVSAAVIDLLEITSKDPAVGSSFLQPFFFYKGFHVVSAQRIAHALWQGGGFAERSQAMALQNRCAEVFGVDIHPAAILGPGLFLDHASSIVIGQTAIVGARCTLLHAVTLGSTGKVVKGDTTGRANLQRHPKLGDDVVVGAGASVLGDISVGRRSIIGAHAIVTQDVDEDITIIGINKVATSSRPSEGKGPDVGRLGFNQTVSGGGRSSSSSSKSHDQQTAILSISPFAGGDI